jgi:hypothetical protein
MLPGGSSPAYRGAMRTGTALLFLLLSAPPLAAFADDAPVPRRQVDRPLLLPAGHLEVAGDTVAIELSEGIAGYPIRIAPSVRYAVSDDLTVGLFHDRRPTLLTFLPASGLCLHDRRDSDMGMLVTCFPLDGSGAPRRYDDLGGEVLYSLTRGPLIDLAAHGRLFAVSLDDATLGMSGGLAGKLRLGDAALAFDPSIYLGFNDRERGIAEPVPYNTDAVYLPLRLSYQLGSAVTPFVSLAAGAKTADIDATWILVGGVGLDVAIAWNLDVGAELLVVLDAGWPYATRPWTDYRAGILRVAWRL